MTKHSGQGRAPIVGIDVLRLLAALMVMLFHFGFKAFSQTGGLIDKMTPLDPGLPGNWPFTWWGWVGVQVFFLISGLVISFSAASSHGRSGRFLRSRVLRLVPVVLIAASFALAVEIAYFGMAPEAGLQRWLRTVIFWPFAPWIMGQFWTLGIEIGFYTLMLIVIMTGSVKALPRIGAALIGLCLVYWLARLGAGGQDPLGRVTALLLLQHGTYFGMGILLADGARNGVRRWHAPFYALGLIAAAMQIRMAASWEGGAAGVDGAWPVALGIFVLCFGLAALSLRYNPLVLGWIGSAGAQKARTMGMMTYPLYLIHNHAGKPVIVSVLDMGGSAWLAVVLAMLVALAGAWVIAVLLEPKVYRLLAVFLDGLAGRLTQRQAKSGTKP